MTAKEQLELKIGVLTKGLSNAATTCAERPSITVTNAYWLIKGRLEATKEALVLVNGEEKEHLDSPGDRM